MLLKRIYPGALACVSQPCIELGRSSKPSNSYNFLETLCTPAEACCVFRQRCSRYDLGPGASIVNKPPVHNHHQRFSESSSRRTLCNAGNLTASLILCIALVFTTGGCGRKQYLDESERELDTAGPSATLDHLAAYYPSGISLNGPGYIVGIEESPAQWISEPGDLKIHPIKGSGERIGFLLNKLQNEPLQYISQVYRYRGRTFGEGNCALYHLYDLHHEGVMPKCGEPGEFPAEQKRNYRNVFKNGWQALDMLKYQLEADIATGRYSHLLILMMGLNTPQEEAIRNFNSIVRAMHRAGGSRFNPLVIGITWPSYSSSDWFSPIWDSLNYLPKAHTADKIGLSWAGALLYDVVKPLKERITTVVIAHSFGARAMSMAICIGPAIRRNQHADPLGNGQVVDYFIALEAAFSLLRFSDTVYPFYEDIYYANGCDRAGKVILTVSQYDSATPNAFWADHAGNFDFYDGFCESEHPYGVACVSANSAGVMKAPFDHNVQMVYVDTSEIMRFDVPGTSGGAHSDIFRLPTGRLMWSFISEEN